MHPADLCSTVARDTPIASLKQHEIDDFLDAMRNMNGETFWNTVVERSAKHHSKAGLQPATYLSQKMDPDYFPSFKVQMFLFW